MTRRSTTAAALCISWLTLFSPGLTIAQEEQSPEIRQAISKGQAYLRQHVRTQTNTGQVALATMALVKSGEPADSPLIKALGNRLASTVKGFEFVASDAGNSIYAAAVTLMALVAIDPNLYFDQIDAIATHILGKQNQNGSWDYNNRTAGDTSQSQYACLALWEAMSAGAYIPPETWDRALHWFITTQDVGGGFVYHPNVPSDGKPQTQSNVTHSMSVAGAGSMVLCRSQLPALAPRQRHAKFELLIPVEDIEEERQPLVTREAAQAAVEKAQRWMSTNISIVKPRGGHHFYYLYGVERYGSLADLRRIGATNWYPEGAQFLMEKQADDGSWRDRYEQIVETSFALLFLGRSTQRTIERIRVVRVGKGTLLGGRGIPSPDATGVITRTKDKFKGIPKAPVEELMALIETPQADVAAEKTAAALENVDSETLVRRVGSDLTRLRELARHNEPGVRQAALTALARTMDYSAVPVLIAALEDDHAGVYLAARNGLRWISRQPTGMELPESPPPPEQRQEAAEKWRKWYESLNIELSARQKFDE